MPRTAEEWEAEQMVLDWNRRYPPGTPVVVEYGPGIKPVRTVTTSRARRLWWMALVHVAGSFASVRLQHVEALR